MRKPGRVPKLTEEVVVYLWAEQRFRRDDLRAIGGETLQVVYRGRPTDDQGPDFKEALVAVGCRLERGDVEVHLRSSDWLAHGHHRDPHYDRVVLHVVLWHDTPGVATLAGGRPVPVLELCHYLPVPFAQLPRLLRRRARPPDPCAGIAARRGEAVLIDTLRQAGEDRFRVKAARFAQELAIRPSEEALYAGILEALGYSKNREPFRQLAAGLPLQVLEAVLWARDAGRREAWAQAVLLGAAGLLPSQRGAETAATGGPWLADLEAIWCTFGGQRVVEVPWRFFRARPENSPLRRVAGAALLCARHLEAGLLAGLEAALSRGEVREAREALEQALIVPAPISWPSSPPFGARPAPARPALVGRERAAVAVVNVVLPFFFALSGLDPAAALGGRALALYHTYPRLAENSVTRTMTRQLVLGGATYRRLGAEHQQGLHHLFDEKCRQGSCSTCLCGGTQSLASRA